MKDIIAHFLPISCHVWRLVKTELLVSEWKAASLSSPRLCMGQQSQPVTPTVPSCRGGGGKKGAGGPTGWLLLPASSPQSASEARAKPPLSQRKVPFSARASESLVSDGGGSLLEPLCLHPLLLQRERWDAGGNPTELKRDSVKTKGSCQGQRPQPFSHIVLPGKGVCSHFTYYMDGWRGNHLV